MLGEINEYCREQGRKAISSKEVGGMELSKLSGNEGESQKIIPRENDGILGEVEEKAMETKNVTKQVMQGRVGLKVLDQNRMVEDGKEQV